ncbi:MAG: hypothetical protein ACTSXX_10090 [Candidatus Baldrarchaeia archaeon]
MCEESKGAVNPYVLLVMVLCVMGVPLVSELLFGGAVPEVIYCIRVIDLVDILVMTPVYFVMFLYVYDRLSRGLGESRVFGYVFMVMLGVFIGGHFMHFTANSVNTYAYEVRGTRWGGTFRGMWRCYCTFWTRC